MRKFINLVALAVLLLAPSAAWAQNTLTVADGTATNGYVPIYGYYADAYLHCQYIYPANDIADATTTVAMYGGSITGMTFYTSESSVSLSASFNVKLMEVTATTLNSFQDVTAATLVYTGSVSVTGGQMTITFDSPYTYNGGNLLVDVSTASTGNYSTTTYYGVSATGASVQGYDYSSASGASPTQRNFIPKTTFSFTGGTAVTCPAVQGFTTSNITSSGATLTWVDTMNSGATYNITYWPFNAAEGDTTELTGLTGNSYTFTGLDANNLYYFSMTTSCSATDQSLPVSGTFATLCGGSTCDLTLQLGSSSTWSNPWTQGAKVQLWQNGILKGEYSSSCTAEVCSSDPVTVTYSGASYSYYDGYATITVLDGGGVTVYSGGCGTGDALATIATPCPSCIPPMGLVAVADSNQIEFSWTPRSGATLFAVYMGDSLVSDNVTDTFYTFQSLPANTQYTLGVRAICTAGDTSSLAIISARTLCGIVTVPYSTGFEGVSTGNLPDCWTAIQTGTSGSGTFPSAYNYSSNAYNGSVYFELESNSGQTEVVALPMMSDISNLMLSFYASIMNNNIVLEVGVMEGATFVPVDTVALTAGSGNNWHGSYYEYDVPFTSYTGTGNRIAMRVTATGSYTLMMDDFSVSFNTGCERPATASHDSVTAHTAVLTWTAVDGATTYNVYYGTVNDPTASSVNSITVSDTTTMLTGLSGQTTYYAWVTTDCGSAESDFRPAGSFTTLISCPRVTGLTVDTTTNDGASIHWVPGGSETSWYLVIDSIEIGVVTDTFYTFTGLDAMTGYTVQVRAICDVDDTSAVRSTTFATSCADPTCNLTAYVTDTYNDSWNGCYINIVQAGVVVGTIDCPSGQSGSTFSYEVCSSAPVKLTFNRGSYPSELGGYVKDGGGNTIFTISSMSSYYTGDSLAGVANPCPECVPPTNVNVTGITADGATLYWTPQDGQSSWIVQIDSLYYNVNDTFYTFSGLNARTSYTVSVATDCSSDTSAFTTVTFTTDCATGSCDITVDMADSFGDGWNGARINFYQNGSLAGYAQLSSGSSGTATINVCSGIPVNYSWQTGSYDTEASYVIYDGSESELYSSATSGVNHSDSIDNACPSCIRPDSLVVTLIDSNELEFAWRVIDSIYNYLVSFNGGAWIAAPTGAYNASGLTPNTAYTFSVMAVCQIGDTSNPRSITVKTSCGQMVVPYTEGFENDNTGVMPSCWTLVRPGYSTYPSVTSSAHTASHGFTLGANYNDSTTVATSLVPLAGDEIYVSFWASVNQGNTLYAGVMTDLAADSTFIPLLTVPYNNSTYTRYEFNTTTLPFYEQYYVAFRLVSGGSNHYADLDDIEIHLDQGCMYPANLAANPGAHNVALTWSNGSSSSANFAIQYREAGTTAWDTNGYTTADTAYNLNGLDAATQYEIRVGFICNTDTLWSNVTTQTSCDLLTLPYSENFDSYANDVMPPCWGWNMSFATHWDGGVFLKANHGGGNEYVVVPQLDGNITKLQIEFDCKVGTIAENDGILFGVADAAGTLVAWLDTIQDVNHSRNAHVHHILNMLNYTVPYGAARIAFAQLRNWGEWALIDNINITQMPDCYPVDSLTAYNLIDPDHTSFTWASLPGGEETQWQVYVDTVTVDIDSIPDSLFTIVSTRSYEIPIGTIQGGGIYTFYVRSYCTPNEQSNWNSITFGAGTYVMNTSSTADTVVACGLVVYDNGGPIAGYLAPSSSALVIRSENAGSELQVFGGAFGWGSSAATLNIYDGEGSTGTPIFTYNTIDGRDTLLDTILATSTTGALTITFNATGSMAHTGYELYIHCVGAALCERPTQLNAVMTEVGEATVTWHGSSAAYDLYYKPTGAATWTVQSNTTDSVVVTGLIPDTTYDMQVVGICGTDTSTASFPIVLNTHYEVVIAPCDPISGLTVGTLTNTTAELSWTSNGSNWEIEVVRVGLTDTVAVSTNPYTLTGLLPNMQYTVRVRTACSGVHVDPYSDWSAAETFTTPLEGPQSYTLTVVSNNDAWGTVTGGGTYVEGTVVTLTATAADGYYFDRWNDGDTNATRSVTVTADAIYTANFAANGTVNNYYTVSVSSNNPAWGSVSGGGEYIEGSTATITATPASGYHFVEWNDGNTDNPRTFTVIASVTYVATFAANTGIDEVTAGTMTLFPNPASTTVTVRLEGFEGTATIEVIDLSGKRVSEFRTQNSELQIDLRQFAQGAYFVRVTGEKATAVSRLIVR